MQFRIYFLLRDLSSVFYNHNRNSPAFEIKNCRTSKEYYSIFSQGEQHRHWYIMEMQYKKKNLNFCVAYQVDKE